MTERARKRPVHVPMTARMLDAVAAQFRALSEPARLRLLEVLREGPHSVTELSEETDLSHANTSKHLLVLARTGFVSRRTDGTRSVYALADETTVRLCSILCNQVTRRVEREFEVLRGR